MRKLKAMLLCGIFALAVQTSAQSQERKGSIPDPTQGYDWKEAARKEGLTAAEIDQLGKNHILITDRAFKQAFTPYISFGLPIFITSDSLLNGFHVLFEESVLRLEKSNARKLGGILKLIWTNLPETEDVVDGKPELVAAAKTRSRIIIATAIRLLGGDPGQMEPRIATLVQKEVERVEKATEALKPGWLGPPDYGFMLLDYTRYKPRGFYISTPELERYFRAVSWLQSIPFRIAKDEELATILMLGGCVNHNILNIDFRRALDIRAFFTMFDTFIGQQDDWGLLTAAEIADAIGGLDEDGLEQAREMLAEMAALKGARPQINDQVAHFPADPTQMAELTFRVIPAYRTPDGAMFQRTTDMRKLARHLPKGLEVCVALGSSFARSQLAAEENGKLLTEIDGCKPFFSGSSLYIDYLRCLEPLVGKPEPDAPPFMSGEAWQIKSCQTALAGWAQLRHTWALQAKQTVEYLCAHRMPTGFVEPTPEFFSRMAALVERTEDALRQAGALTEDVRDLAADIRSNIKLLEKKKGAKDFREALSSLSPDEAELVLNLFDASLMTWQDAPRPANRAVTGDLPEFLDMMRKSADDLEQGRIPAPDSPMGLAIEFLKMDIEPLWRSLGMLSRRLESLAYKQLRGVPFSDEENRFIRSYGARLAAIMLYGGNSYETPRDDAPRMVDVFHSTSLEKYLEVGIARPRAIYVLYPWKGGEILCSGAIMPYYEFAHGARLTDAEWKGLLDSPKRPKSPVWLTPVISPGGLSAPKLGHAND